MQNFETQSIVFLLRPESRNLFVEIDTGAGTPLPAPDTRRAGVAVSDLMLCLANDVNSQQKFVNAFPELSQTLSNGAHIALHQIQIPTT
jgi:hypothetical protein